MPQLYETVQLWLSKLMSGSVCLLAETGKRHPTFPYRVDTLSKLSEVVKSIYVVQM